MCIMPETDLAREIIKDAPQLVAVVIVMGYVLIKIVSLVIDGIKCGCCKSDKDKNGN